MHYAVSHDDVLMTDHGSVIACQILLIVLLRYRVILISVCGTRYFCMLFIALTIAGEREGG